MQGAAEKKEASAIQGATDAARGGVRAEAQTLFQDGAWNFIMNSTGAGSRLSV